ncbi:recombinase family protein, partial [Kitasatospora nipponensis]|uniref:recombinase family protein n=1 Tax=Kitasatospora nipponensis TaxID=258049 RepID=UPI0031CFDEA7
MASKKLALDDNAPVTPYDGCGMCFVGTRSLSRVVGPTGSPEKQRDFILEAVAKVGGHVIAWADDWEVSGAVDPLRRPALGPWLREEMGAYNGLAGASVERIGRNVRDALNTEAMITEAGRLLVTADHEGIWDLTDP